MTSKAGNVTTTQSQTAQAASVSQEFGDVSQYRELNAIGTGELVSQFVLSVLGVLSVLSVSSVLVWTRVYYFVISCPLMN